MRQWRGRQRALLVQRRCCGHRVGPAGKEARTWAVPPHRPATPGGDGSSLSPGGHGRGRQGGGSGCWLHVACATVRLRGGIAAVRSSRGSIHGHQLAPRVEAAGQGLAACTGALVTAGGGGHSVGIPLVLRFGGSRHGRSRALVPHRSAAGVASAASVQQRLWQQCLSRGSGGSRRAGLGGAGGGGRRGGGRRPFSWHASCAA